MGCVQLLLIGCAAHSTAPAGFSGRDSTCPKLLEQSRAAGVDYVPTLRKAAKGDDAAMKSLLELTDSKFFSTDAEQCHIEALAELLNRLGDRQFSVALTAETADVRRAVVNGLIIELADYPSAETSRAAFADKYPFTAATVTP
jgi:hypothetical protein